jgi:hypothetical protein
MAGLYMHATSGAIALPAASTNKVICQLSAPAYHRLRVSAIGFFFTGIGTTDTPILCKICVGNAGTTPVLSGSVGAYQSKNSVDQANWTGNFKSLFYNSWTTNPTAATQANIIEESYIHPQSFEYQFKRQYEEYCWGGTSAVQLLQFEVLTGATITGSPNVTVEIEYEE